MKGIPTMNTQAPNLGGPWAPLRERLAEVSRHGFKLNQYLL